MQGKGGVEPIAPGAENFPIQKVVEEAKPKFFYHEKREFRLYKLMKCLSENTSNNHSFQAMQHEIRRTEKTNF